MSDAVSDIDDDSMTDADVIAYLQDNPSFLRDNPEAVELLLPPGQGDGRKVADFQAFLIERLKADKDKVMKTTREIVETSRANLNNQQRVHAGVLRLLESQSFEDFIHCITMDLASLLDVDIAVLVVEADGKEIPHISTSGVRVIPEGTVDKWMRGKNVLLQDNISGLEPVYGGGAALLRSQIMLRVDISMDTPPAILAFGSRDPGMFHEGQATDQITFLARVIERCFRAWLNLPV